MKKPPSETLSMRRCFIALISCLLLAACAPGPRGTWRASHPNGDGPAIAIELVRDGKKFSGSMFLLDPARPNDFSSGTSFPMKIKSADDQEIHYSVEFLPHEPDALILRLSKPVDGPSFHAVMEAVNGRGRPIDFSFDRVSAK